MKAFLASVIFICGLVLPGHAQQEPENLVPNGGFEAYSSTPLGWFYSGSDFTRVVKYWESPTAASPDVYGPRVFVPSQWKEKGFGASKPHGGKSMIGLTLYGCEGGKPHCREYAQIQLTEPLVVGQRYALSFWTKHLPRSMRINNLAAAFSFDRIASPLDQAIDLKPELLQKDIIECGRHDWVQITHEFVADSAQAYLIIGNFMEDHETEHRRCPATDHLNFGYYYVDDVALIKLPPILDVPIPEDDLSKLELKEGQVIELKNIYFDHDRADFLPRSFRELNTLVGIMRSNPSMTIEVKGHTDNVGTAEYNYELSLARARAVVEYLVSNGIASSRASYSGYGSTMPLGSNETNEGRQQNRRVEFLILTN